MAHRVAANRAFKTPSPRANITTVAQLDLCFYLLDIDR